MRYFPVICEYMCGKGKEVTQLEDREIIALFEARSEQAIEELGKKHGRYVSQVALNILHDAQDAEETVNDTYLAVWNTIPPQKPERFRPWLGRVVRNIAFDRWDKLHAQKRYAGAEVLLDELAESVPSHMNVEKEVETAELAAVISTWLERQPERDRMFFILRYWKGEPLKSIAARHGIREKTLAQRMYVMRRSLKLCLENEGIMI